YVDYGLPWMFVPIFLYGFAIGAVYSGLLRLFKHRDIAVSLATMICWLSLFRFESSWSKMTGLALTLIVYVGFLAFVIDRLWYERFRATAPTTWNPEQFARDY